MEEEDVISNFTCEICVEPAQSLKKFQNNTLCHHPFCLECIAKYIAARLEDGSGGAAIKCPALNCNHPLDPLSCQPVLPKDLFIKWCDRLCDSSVSKIDTCYCPHTTCSTLVLNECRDSVKKTNCPNCKNDFCFKCKIPWHAGYWCSETGQLRDNNDILLGKLVEERNWVRCYNCGHAIEKDEGCRQIQCRCGAVLCYQCGSRFHFSRDCEAGGNLCCGGSCFKVILMLVLAAMFGYFMVHPWSSHN